MGIYKITRMLTMTRTIRLIEEDEAEEEEYVIRPREEKGLVHEWMCERQVAKGGSCLAQGHNGTPPATSLTCLQLPLTHTGLLTWPR